MRVRVSSAWLPKSEFPDPYKGHCPGSMFRDAWGGWSLEVEQSRWGHRAPKLTRLYFVGIEPHEIPPMPPPVADPGGRIEFMCEKEREATPPAFAAWLVAVARGVTRDP